MFWAFRACLAFALPPSASSPLLVFSLSGAAGRIQPLQQRAPPKGPRVSFCQVWILWQQRFYSLLLCDPRGAARAETRSSLHHLSAQETSEVEEVREEDEKCLVLEGARKKVPPPSARTLTGKGEMRERPWKLDKAGQKETDIFSTRLFLWIHVPNHPASVRDCARVPPYVNVWSGGDGFIREKRQVGQLKGN